MAGKNKGEWSEIYAMFKVLVDGQLHPGDENLVRDESVYYPVLAVMRELAKDSVLKFSPNDSGNIIISINNQPNYSKTISKSEFIKHSQLLLEQIRQSSGAFNCEATEAFIHGIHPDFKVKAPSSAKADIFVKIHDLTQEPTLGFSVKSKLGASSTLLNASKSTRFQFSLEGSGSVDKLFEFANCYTRDNLRDILASGYKLTYLRPYNSTFMENLIMIDSRLDNIVAEMLLAYNTKNLQNIDAIVEDLGKNNPLKYPGSKAEIFYEFKVKQLLISIALGMRPATQWDGTFYASGGCLFIREDGEILCFHFYKYNEFANNLYKKTRLETPSTSAGRSEIELTLLVNENGMTEPKKVNELSLEEFHNVAGNGINQFKLYLPFQIRYTD